MFHVKLFNQNKNKLMFHMKHCDEILFNKNALFYLKYIEVVVCWRDIVPRETFWNVKRDLFHVKQRGLVLKLNSIKKDVSCETPFYFI